MLQFSGGYLAVADAQFPKPESVVKEVRMRTRRSPLAMRANKERRLPGPDGGAGVDETAPLLAHETFGDQGSRAVFMRVGEDVAHHFRRQSVHVGNSLLWC